MSTTLPALSSAAANATAPSGPATGTIVSVAPPALARLPPGTTVAAVVIDISKAGVTTLQTAVGPLFVKLATAFPPGTALQLQMGPPLLVRPTSLPVDVSALITEASLVGDARPTCPPTTTAPLALDPPPRTQGPATLLATVVGPAPPGTMSGPLPSGTTLQVRIADLSVAPSADGSADPATPPTSPEIRSQVNAAYGGAATRPTPPDGRPLSATATAAAPDLSTAPARVITVMMARPATVTDPQAAMSSSVPGPSAPVDTTIEAYHGAAPMAGDARAVPLPLAQQRLPDPQLAAASPAGRAIPDQPASTDPVQGASNGGETSADGSGAAPPAEGAARSAATGVHVTTASEPLPSEGAAGGVTTSANISPARGIPLPPAGAVEAPPTIILGVVAPNTLGMQPLVATPLGLLALSGTSPLPVGAALALMVIGEPRLPAPPAADRPIGLSNAEQERAEGTPPDPIVKAVLAMLDDVVGASGPRLLAQLPITTNLILRSLQSALSTGGSAPHDTLIRSTLQENAANIGRNTGSDDPAPALTPRGTDWHSVVVPMFADGGPPPVRLSFRARPPCDGRTSGPGPDESRFLVDINLTRLGPVQLDGLIQSKSRRFDLILRSHHSLPEPLTQSISALFSQSLLGYGLFGGIQFRDSDQFVATGSTSDGPPKGLFI